jgi:hypothetical protein
MTIQKTLARKIARDGLISLFLYALPLVLMFLYFHIKGERPWEKKAIQSPVAIHPTTENNKP